MYVVDAADGTIDDPEATVVGYASGKEYSIELKSQSEVVFKKGEKTYTYSMDNGWAEEEVAVTVADNAVATNLTDSTPVEVVYGGYSVFAKA